MSDYPGRFISATDPTVTSESASGVWTLEEAAKYKQAGTWPVQSYGDPNFNQTVLLLHGDGTNGAQNNTFLDGSTNNFTITRNGNTTQGTFSPFSLAAGEWSNYFDGSGDYLTVSDNLAWQISTDYTIECWIYPTGGAGTFRGLINHGTDGSNYWLFGINTSNELTFNEFTGGSYIIPITNAGTVPLNTWSHVAFVVNGSSATAYVNGVAGTSTTKSGTSGNYTGTLKVGSNVTGSGSYFTGYISNLRIVKGTAVYTAAFTPPTAPLTAITNTSLLTCQSNRFVDNSTNAFAITRNGDVRVTPFSPFAPSAAYDPAVNGGSGYFDGTADYLNTDKAIGLALGTNTWTIGVWVYTTVLAAQTLISQSISNNTSNLGFNASLQPWIQIYQSGTNRLFSTATGALVAGQWNYLTLSHLGGGQYQFHINGAAQTATSASGYYWNTTLSTATVTALGYYNYSNSNYVNGYLSDFRVKQGVDTTVPTAPLTPTSSDILLLNFTNAGIFDNTGKNNLETLGNAQVDTTTKKYGTGSLEFDGNNDYLKFASNVDLAFGTGDFTIEAWVYRAGEGASGSGASQIICDFRTAEPETNILLYKENAGNDIEVYINGSIRILSTTDIALDTWYHIALVRASGSTKLYIDGVNEGSTYSDTNNYTSTNLTVGGRFAVVSGDFRSWNGFIDDLRITKGVARYPTEPFPTKAFQDR